MPTGHESDHEYTNLSHLRFIRVTCPAQAGFVALFVDGPQRQFVSY